MAPLLILPIRQSLFQDGLNCVVIGFMTDVGHQLRVDHDTLFINNHDGASQQAAQGAIHHGDTVGFAEARIAETRGRHEIIQTHEMEQPQYRANPVNRCYYCKHELFTQLRSMALPLGAVVVDGNNADDRSDYRPGREAARGVLWFSGVAKNGIGNSSLVRFRQNVRIRSG